MSQPYFQNRRFALVLKNGYSCRSLKIKIINPFKTRAKLAHFVDLYLSRLLPRVQLHERHHPGLFKIRHPSGMSAVMPMHGSLFSANELSIQLIWRGRIYS